jgi:hypothetical protein
MLVALPMGSTVAMEGNVAKDLCRVCARSHRLRRCGDAGAVAGGWCATSHRVRRRRADSGRQAGALTTQLRDPAEAERADAPRCRQAVPGALPEAVAARLAVRCFLTWNVSNVGAVADPLAGAYGTSLAVIGLLTAALFVTHLVAQLPAGIWSDRFGPHRVALAACCAAAAEVPSSSWTPASPSASLDDSWSASAPRRASSRPRPRAGRGGGTVLQGLYGGATMAGGGLALLIVHRSPTRRRGAQPSRAGLCSPLQPRCSCSPFKGPLRSAGRAAACSGTWRCSRSARSRWRRSGWR